MFDSVAAALPVPALTHVRFVRADKQVEYYIQRGAPASPHSPTFTYRVHTSDWGATDAYISLPVCQKLGRVANLTQINPSKRKKEET